MKTTLKNKDIEDTLVPVISSANVVDAIVDWCEALRGNVALTDAVSALIQGLGAEAGVLVRHNLADRFCTQIARYDSKGQTSPLPLTDVYGPTLFGKLLEKSKPATLWLASEYKDQSADFLGSDFAGWVQARQMREFAVLVLSSGSAVQDHLELHFREPVASMGLHSLNGVLPAIARSWAARDVGVVVKSIASRRPVDRDADDRLSQNLLGAGNPASLSRAEFRVCLLLSRGLSVAGVCSELGLAESTVRSHLRSIYAKSDKRNLAELIFCLIRSEQPAMPALAQTA